MARTLPKDFAVHYLPPDTISAADLVQWNFIKQATGLVGPSLTQFHSTNSPELLNPQFLSRIPLPRPETITQLESNIGNQWKEGVRSLRVETPGQESIDCPLWLISYWRRVSVLKRTADVWRTAIEWVNSLQDISLPDHVLRADMNCMFQQIPATGVLNGFAFARSSLTETLALYLSSQRWFSDECVDQGLDILAARLASSTTSVLVVGTQFWIKLKNLYTNVPRKSPKDTKWLAAIANKLTSSSRNSPFILVSIAHVNAQVDKLLKDGNHWTPFVIDYKKCTIRYVNQMLPADDPPLAFVKVIQTFIKAFPSPAQSITTPFRLQTLRTHLQTDSVHCRAYAQAILRHEFLGEPLISGRSVIQFRIRLFMECVQVHCQAVRLQYIVSTPKLINEQLSSPATLVSNLLE